MPHIKIYMKVNSLPHPIEDDLGLTILFVNRVVLPYMALETV